MTVTSGKDVCRKIGHSDEVDGENQENTYIHDSFALDAGYANYIRETVPKTVWSNDYLRELWDENAKYLKSIRESKNGYGFDDIGMGAAYAYSTMYQKIVEGYRNGTREVYVCDDSESGKRRLLLMDEELEKLNKGFTLTQLSVEQDFLTGGDDNIFGETKESCLAAIDKVLERIENPLAAVTEERAAYLQQEKEFYTVLASKIRE